MPSRLLYGESREALLFRLALGRERALPRAVGRELRPSWNERDSTAPAISSWYQPDDVVPTDEPTWHAPDHRDCRSTPARARRHAVTRFHRCPGSSGVPSGAAPRYASAWPPFSCFCASWWHVTHRPSQFPVSQNSAESPRWGLTWCTRVAALVLPAFSQGAQRGWLRRYVVRAFAQRCEYPLCAAVGLIVRARSGACTLMVGRVAWCLDVTARAGRGQPFHVERWWVSLGRYVRPCPSADVERVVLAVVLVHGAAGEPVRDALHGAFEATERLAAGAHATR